MANDKNGVALAIGDAVSVDFTEHSGMLAEVDFTVKTISDQVDANGHAAITIRTVEPAQQLPQKSFQVSSQQVTKTA